MSDSYPLDQSAGTAPATLPTLDADAPGPDVLRALQLVREGRIYSLARPRFPGMPLFSGHPRFDVVTYRTPRGLRLAQEEPWGPGNDARLGYVSEMIIASSHSGAHIDAHAHMTVGPEDAWHAGTADADIGDKGVLRGDATELPPIWARGLLYDVPAFRGVPFLPAGEVVGADELRAVGEAQGIASPGAGDVVLVRTGYMSHWPDVEAMTENKGPGPDISAARWLAECGVIATGSDTETYEVQPAPRAETPHNPQPVHTYLLIERGIYLMECLDLEEIAKRGYYEFLFVALPLKIRGATGSMIDPIAVV